MPTSFLKKINIRSCPRGEHGEIQLAAGEGIAMRLWESEEPNDQKKLSQRDYEMVGLVIEGKAELWLEGATTLLEPGDSWVVPKGARHTYKILESFTAIEAITPPVVVRQSDPAQAA